MSNTGMCVAALTVTLCANGAEGRTSTPPSPEDFVTAAAQSDQYEIEAARVALVEGQDARVRMFAQAMIRDHTRMSDELRRAALAAGLPPPPPGMSSDQARLLSSLQSVRGADFDKAYARQQALAHAQAVAVEESFAKAGSDSRLRKAAQTALPVIRDHLTMAQQLSGAIGAS